ncbi:MDR family MFS transporter [Marinactinospora thermotolerans]|uniref:MFS transporter, DHA2 family, lincomycin resistance protein n=1 Tax=Marinactinospora thermotolerans DSM 45154 TaxID=1122192 RepID=A0A1T4K172_9ACTN|nr:MDR family MFS transporter [Marinactinospora thermotolerans]SJZ36236.1 MFS transporter, DHA2 family, lincomycin resistance protein [Marinactinospora thermotolerans DSM 45154]
MTVDQRPADQAATGRGPASDDALPRQVKVVLGLLLVASFVVILNETIMSVALPRLMVELEITAATAQWLTTGFLLTMAVVIPTTGLILQRFTTRSVFITAMSLFTVGTLLAALAPGFGVLLAGRVIQASGTAVMLPLMTTMVLNFVPASRRGRTMGLITVVIAVAPAVGPTFSGLILSALSWRWLFLVVLPIALLSLALGAALVKNITVPKRVRFDVLSIVLSALAFGGLIYGLSSIGESTQGHAPIPPLIPIGVGVAALALFVLRQLRLQRDDAALLDLRPFRSRAFVLGVVVLLVSMGALFGTLVLLPIYLQNVLGLTTLQTGLMLLPGGLTMGLIAPVIGRLFDRVGPRPLVIPGTFVVAGALGLMTLLDESSPIALVLTIHVSLNIGLGFVMTPLMTSALGSLERSLYSHGSAIVNTLQQLAGAAGTALFITIMTTGTAAGLTAGLDQVAAQASGIHTAFLWGAGLALVAAAASFLVRRPSGSTEGMPAGH